MRISISVLLILALMSLTVSCGSDGDSQGPCDQFNWRSETPDQIVCPYTADCVCPSTDVCCVLVEQDKFSSASCSELTACSGLAFQCDGPEDCPAGESCCAVLTTGGGSSCKDPMDCIGLEDVVLCRKNEDCGLGEGCLPAEPDSYFEGVAGYCD